MLLSTTSPICFAQESPKRLPPTVVTATRTPVEADRVGRAVTVITAEELQERGITFVHDALRSVPGVAVSTTGGRNSTTQIRLRGAEANHTVVRIDGVDAAQPESGEARFQNLRVADIERIEVMRGPGSVLYGAGGIGGVVNIVTKQSAGKPIEASFDAEYGSYQTRQIGGAVRGAVGDLRYSASADHYFMGGFNYAPKRSDDVGESDNYGTFALAGRAAYDVLPNLTLKGGMRYGESSTRTDGQSFVPPGERHVVATEAVTNFETDKSFGRDAAGDVAAELSLLGGRLRQKLQVSHANERLKTFRTFKNETVSRTNQRRTAYAYQLDFDVARDNTATVGVDVVRERIKTQTAENSMGNRGYFGQYQLGLFEALYLTAGLRHQNDDRFGSKNVYQGSAAYLLRDWGTKLKGSVGTGFVTPTPFESFDATFGNRNLKPEESVGWDAGVEQELVDGKLGLDVTYFQSRVKNLIVFDFATGFRNVGKSSSRGIETSVKASPVRDLDLVIGYTYAHTENKSTGDQLVRRPRHVFSANAAYRFLDGKARVTAGVYLAAQQDDTRFTAAFASEQQKLKDYKLFNLGLSYQLTESIELHGRIENLFNADYEEVYGFRQPGISGFAGVRARF
ncbi:MAG: TonB-dependent receptor [Alphaproteobacteria bacterium]|nr:TonB-dependent receptor [Alphaproteobacteria bacterium]